MTILQPSSLKIGSAAAQGKCKLGRVAGLSKHRALKFSTCLPIPCSGPPWTGDSDHAHQHCFDRGAHRCNQVGNPGHEFSQIRVQDDDLNLRDTTQCIDSIERRESSVRPTASVRGLRGKCSDFQPGELDLFDQRRRQELFGQYFAGQWDVLAFGSQSAGGECEWIESERGRKRPNRQNRYAGLRRDAFSQA